MRFTVDVGELAVVPGRDTEPAEVDLTRDCLSDACLDAAVEGMRASYRARSSPDGTPWAPLSAATVREEGHAVIGVRSGVETALDRETVAVPWFGDRALAYAFRKSRHLSEDW